MKTYQVTVVKENQQWAENAPNVADNTQISDKNGTNVENKTQTTPISDLLTGRYLITVEETAPDNSETNTSDASAPLPFHYGKITAFPTVNVREIPSTASSILARYHHGRIVLFHPSQETFCQVIHQGKTAFISSKYINDMGEAPQNTGERIAAIALGEEGIKEKDIVQAYNAPPTSPWCQIFANYMARQCVTGEELTRVPTTSSTPKGIEQHLLKGSFAFVSSENKAAMREYSQTVKNAVTSGLTKAEQSYIPAKGDFVYYRWSSKPKDHASHVGIVVDVEEGRIVTIEGNVSKQVAKRVRSITDPQITGYGKI